MANGAPPASKTHSSRSSAAAVVAHEHVTANLALREPRVPQHLDRPFYIRLRRGVVEGRVEDLDAHPGHTASEPGLTQAGVDAAGEPRGLRLPFEHVHHGLDMRTGTRQEVVVEHVPPGLDLQEAQPAFTTRHEAERAPPSVAFGGPKISSRRSRGVRTRRGLLRSEGKEVSFTRLVNRHGAVHYICGRREFAAQECSTSDAARAGRTCTLALPKPHSGAQFSGGKNRSACQACQELSLTA